MTNRDLQRHNKRIAILNLRSQGLSFSRIAQLLGSSSSTVKSIYDRALLSKDPAIKQRLNIVKTEEVSKK